MKTFREEMILRTQALQSYCGQYVDKGTANIKGMHIGNNY